MVRVPGERWFRIGNIFSHKRTQHPYAIPPIAIDMTTSAAEIVSALLPPNSDASTRITEIQGIESIDTGASTIIRTGVKTKA